MVWVSFWTITFFSQEKILETPVNISLGFWYVFLLAYEGLCSCHTSHGRKWSLLRQFAPCGESALWHFFLFLKGCWPYEIRVRFFQLRLRIIAFFKIIFKVFVHTHTVSVDHISFMFCCWYPTLTTVVSLNSFISTFMSHIHPWFCVSIYNIGTKNERKHGIFAGLSFFLMITNLNPE